MHKCGWGYVTIAFVKASYFKLMDGCVSMLNDHIHQKLVAPALVGKLWKISTATNLHYMDIKY